MGWPQSQNPPTLAITPPLAVADGGTGAASAAAARTNLAVPNVLTQRMTPAPFMHASLAAGLTDHQCDLCGKASFGAGASGYLALRDGSVTGVSVLSSIVAAGAALTATVFVAGVATAATVNLAIGASSVSATFAAGTVPYVAGNRLDIRLTTPAGWTSTTADVTIWFEIEG